MSKKRRNILIYSEKKPTHDRGLLEIHEKRSEGKLRSAKNISNKDIMIKSYMGATAGRKG